MSFRKIRIGVMGASECTKDAYQLAEQVGRLIAMHEAVLICGGRDGIMEAAAKGAKEAGGLTVGILPGGTDLGANAFIDIPIVTGLGDARNMINVLSSHVIIAINGGFGTLSEIALALKTQTPVVGLHTWSFTIDPQPEGMQRLLFMADTAEGAVSKALDLAKRSRTL
jgi:uncharacterized protein (TIGR00725 family)